MPQPQALVGDQPSRSLQRRPQHQLEMSAGSPQSSQSQDISSGFTARHQTPPVQLAEEGCNTHPQQTPYHMPRNSEASTNLSSTGEPRKVSCEDIQLVQNLIERCLQLYMNQREVIGTLLNQAKIEPGFTSLVWQKLEEQNPEFFKAYYTRLKLKRHIIIFNQLLDKQVQMMQELRILPPSSAVNGTHVHRALDDQSMYTASQPMHGGAAQDKFQRSYNSSKTRETLDTRAGCASTTFPGGFTPDDTSSGIGAGAFPFNTTVPGLPTSMPLDVSYNQESHGNSALHFGPPDGDGNVTLGSLGQLPRNFSLSDLTADLCQNNDLGLLGNFSSPFMTSEAEAFLQSFDDNKQLENASRDH